MVEIRDLGPEDEADFRRLWQGFLDYYQMSLPQPVTDATWSRLMDPACTMKARVAQVDGVVAGFALHQHHPSSWVLGDDCYLEDLFVDPAFRGQGLGRALIEDLMALARSRGWHRIWWATDQDNEGARKLYDSLASCDNHVRYRRVL